MEEYSWKESSNLSKSHGRAPQMVSPSCIQSVPLPSFANMENMTCFVSIPRSNHLPKHRNVWNERDLNWSTVIHLYRHWYIHSGLEWLAFLPLKPPFPSNGLDQSTSLKCFPPCLSNWFNLGYWYQSPNPYSKDFLYHCFLSLQLGSCYPSVTNPLIYVHALFLQAIPSKEHKVEPTVWTFHFDNPLCIDYSMTV